MAGKYKRIKGVPELLQKLGELRQWDVLNAISYKATVGAAKDLREAARLEAAISLEAPTDTGALLRGFAIKKIENGSRRGYTVGVRSGNKRKGDLKRSKKQDAAADDPYYWWFLEFGTKTIAPRGFFRRAIAAEKAHSEQLIKTIGMKAVLSAGNSAAKSMGAERETP